MKIIADIHTHTIASGHAYSTLKENIDQASFVGLDYLGVSDHTPGMPNTTCEGYFQNLKVIHKEINNIRVLKGAEANIIDAHGLVDLSYEASEQLDYVIASLHNLVIDNMGIIENTQAIIGAMTNPHVKVIGHPDDDQFPLDYKAIAAAAKLMGVALELNNSSLSPYSSRSGGVRNAHKMLDECARVGARIMIGSDSHIWYNIGYFEYALSLLEKCSFPQELVVNANRTHFEEFMNLTTITKKIAIAM